MSVELKWLRFVSVTAITTTYNKSQNRFYHKYY